MLVSYIVVTYNSESFISNCIESIHNQSHIHKYEIIIVDNNSTDKTLKILESFKSKTTVIKSIENLGFARGNNTGIKLAKGKYIVLVNPDAILTPFATYHLISTYKYNGLTGIVGGAINNEENIRRPFPQLKNILLYLKGDFSCLEAKSNIEEVDWVCGAFCLFTKKDFNSIGNFDSRYFLYYEETDLCLRFKNAGKKVYINKSAKAYHIGGACSDEIEQDSFDNEKMITDFKYNSKLLYFNKHEGLIRTLLMITIELFFYILAFTKRFFSKHKKDQFRKNYAQKQIHSIIKSCLATHFGFHSPKHPWRIS